MDAHQDGKVQARKENARPLQEHLKTALLEIGPIEPWWSEDDGMFVIEHAASPMVMHADPDKKEVKAGYLRALTGFIEERLVGNIAESVERVTFGRGGARTGAGRPVGTKKEPKTRVYLPVDMAAWIQEPEHLEQVWRLMQGIKIPGG